MCIKNVQKGCLPTPFAYATPLTKPLLDFLAGDDDAFARLNLFIQSLMSPSWFPCFRPHTVATDNAKLPQGTMSLKSEFIASHPSTGPSTLEAPNGHERAKRRP